MEINNIINMENDNFKIIFMEIHNFKEKMRK